jgi:HAL2 family 3'(2'),5'-bisphosphate nucleotidase
MPVEREIRDQALRAVQLACQVAKQVQQSLVSEEIITKKDNSPVTVGDYSVQALVIHLLSTAFPDYPFVAEEDSKTLSENHDVKKSVLQFVQQQFPEISEEELIKTISKGREGLRAASNSKRWWTLDPIDGTMGFLRKDQYAVALALMEDNKPVLGILGCPSLPLSNTSKEQGCILVGVKGEGSYIRPIGSDTETKISVSSQSDPKFAIFTESFVSRGYAHELNQGVTGRLHVQAEPLRIDSQCKYAMVARGDSDVYLRLSSLGYKECIWDHAAGDIIVQEAGGHVVDFNNAPLDYSRGTKLTHNVGIVCTNKVLLAPVLEALPKDLSNPNV